MKKRRGFSVAIKKKDGTEFLCCSDPGLLPAVFTQRTYAVKYKRRLMTEGFQCRVVPVRFRDVKWEGSEQ